MTKNLKLKECEKSKEFAEFTTASKDDKFVRREEGEGG